MSIAEGIPQVVAAADMQVDAAANATEELSLDSQTAEKVVAQVKHYFSDANLNHDSYMRKGVSMHDGWVPFSNLIRFNKLRQLVGVPEDPKTEETSSRGSKKDKRGPPPPPIAKKYVDLLASVVKDGVTNEDSVEVNDTGIRRKVPYVESGEWFARTVHVKGLPYGEEPAGDAAGLTAFFAQHGEVTLLRLRRNPRTKAFKGNALVEFATVEQAEEVAQMTDLEYSGRPLTVVSLSAYHDVKKAAGEYMHPELRKPGETYLTFEEWCAANGRELPSANGKPRKSKKGKEVEKVETPPPPPKEIVVVPGVLVKFTGVEGEIGVTELKQALSVAGAVKYVDILPGASEGIVRFKEPVATQAIEAHADGLAVEGSEVVLKLGAVGKDEEDAFYERAKEASEIATARKASNPNNKKGKRAGGNASRVEGAPRSKRPRM
ncbi:hypothetical protein IWW39_001257 [Coemansia spiralis]|uniref:HTH La-type RNA-binding domain-containing protein n=1 Tax=Coemansia spiralis TaxID=417178 RepID=A0A9W8GQN4_9FUNG|nr:hypothetical protein IWW39_001257 [Coemansia spiralis]